MEEQMRRQGTGEAAAVEEQAWRRHLANAPAEERRMMLQLADSAKQQVRNKNKNAGPKVRS